MCRLKAYFHAHKNVICLCFGIGAVMVMAVLYLILKTDSIVPYHDQLDGEVSGYMLRAKYLFSSISTYPEVMNGITENGLFPPAILIAHLYCLFSPFTAYAIAHIICMLIAFLGMYYCILLFTKNNLIALGCGILFAYVPFLGVYGLCQYGLPMFFICSYSLYHGRRKIACLIYIALFGLTSSLVLIGYAILGFSCLFILYLLIKKEFRKHLWFTIQTIVLLGVYLLTNMSLILQIFGVGDRVTSHKEALVLEGTDFMTSFLDIFYRGTIHVPAHQQILVIASTLFILISLILYKRISKKYKPYCIAVYAMYGLNLFFALFYAIVYTSTVAAFRNRMGGVIKEFQADRLFWLSTPLWFFILAILLFLAWERIKVWYCSSYGKLKKWLLISCTSFVGIAVVMLYALTIYYYSNLNKQVHRFIHQENYEQLTWSDFYAIDIMQEIKNYIGKDQSEYRTLSFGIYPAAALYNGFYCLDAYSNNYSLDYMKEFRNIIAKELDKNSELAHYYDEWGCRCYLYSGEWWPDRTIASKDEMLTAPTLDFDFGAAYDMGARYLFSAVIIPNASELGLTLMKEEPFVTSTSYYAIYLYEIWDVGTGQVFNNENNGDGPYRN